MDEDRGTYNREAKCCHGANTIQDTIFGKSTAKVGGHVFCISLFYSANDTGVSLKSFTYKQGCSNHSNRGEIIIIFQEFNFAWLQFQSSLPHKTTSRRNRSIKDCILKAHAAKGSIICLSHFLYLSPPLIYMYNTIFKI